MLVLLLHPIPLPLPLLVLGRRWGQQEWESVVGMGVHIS